MKTWPFKSGGLSWGRPFTNIPLYLSASEIWSDKRGSLWWEWPYKRDSLWWEWPYKRGNLWWEWPYKRGSLWWEWPYKRGNLWWEWPYKTERVLYFYIPFTIYKALSDLTKTKCRKFLNMFLLLFTASDHSFCIFKTFLTKILLLLFSFTKYVLVRKLRDVLVWLHIQYQV